VDTRSCRFPFRGVPAPFSTKKHRANNPPALALRGAPSRIRAQAVPTGRRRSHFRVLLRLIGLCISRARIGRVTNREDSARSAEIKPTVAPGTTGNRIRPLQPGIPGRLHCQKIGAATECVSALGAAALSKGVVRNRACGMRGRRELCAALEPFLVPICGLNDDRFVGSPGSPCRRRCLATGLREIVIQICPAIRVIHLHRDIFR
jgi:hypothetical protein